MKKMIMKKMMMKKMMKKKNKKLNKKKKEVKDDEKKNNKLNNKEKEVKEIKKMINFDGLEEIFNITNRNKKNINYKKDERDTYIKIFGNIKDGNFDYRNRNVHEIIKEKKIEEKYELIYNENIYNEKITLTEEEIDKVFNFINEVYKIYSSKYEELKRNFYEYEKDCLIVYNNEKETVEKKDLMIKYQKDMKNRYTSYNICEKNEENKEIVSNRKNIIIDEYCQELIKNIIYYIIKRNYKSHEPLNNYSNFGKEKKTISDFDKKIKQYENLIRCNEIENDEERILKIFETIITEDKIQDKKDIIKFTYEIMEEEEIKNKILENNKKVRLFIKISELENKINLQNGINDIKKKNKINQLREKINNNLVSEEKETNENNITRLIKLCSDYDEEFEKIMKE